MKNKGILLGLLAVFAIFSLEPALAQTCPLCKISLMQSPEGRHMAKAFNHGILFLLAMPYLLIGTIGGVVFSLIRRQNRKAESEHE